MSLATAPLLRSPGQGGLEGLVWTSRRASCSTDSSSRSSVHASPPQLPPAVLYKGKQVCAAAHAIGCVGSAALQQACQALGLPADGRVLVLDNLDAWCPARVALLAKAGEAAAHTAHDSE